MKLKFRVNTLMLLLSYYCVFVNLPYFTYYNISKYICIVVIGIYIISNIRILQRREFIPINIILLAFSAVVLYTSWINRSVIKERDPFLAAIVFLVVLLELFLLMEIAAVKGNTRSLINVYFVVTAIIVVIVDVLAVMGIRLGTGERGRYLIGTKFQLVYIHFFLIVLYMVKHGFTISDLKKHRMGVLLLLGLTLAMSAFTDCTTGIVGVFLLAIMLAVYSRHPGILHNPMVFVGVLIVSFALSFALSAILLWPPVEYIIVQLLDKDITLTSRTRIFLMVPLLLKNHYLLGYGYGTTYELGRRLGGFPNTQNALWEWVWQCGVVGTILLVLLIYCVIRYTNKSHKLSSNNNSKYILILLYLFSLLASIEITIDLSYLGYLAMLIPLTYTREKLGKQC